MLLPAVWLSLLVFAEFSASSKLAAEMVTQPCPKHCTCDGAKASMRCTHLRGGIPQPVGQQASFFSFTNKTAALSMMIIHRAIFSHPTLSRDNFSHPIFAELIDLAFTMTNIETIESRTFENLPKLSRLVFKYNQNLKFVEPEAFFGLNLQRLEFHESPELALQRDTVFVETRTNKLSITKCGLTDFSYDVFHLLLKISLPMTLLNLEGNSIASIDSRFWPLFQNISAINLEANSLLCVDVNYWLYSMIRTKPERFVTGDDAEKKPELSCTKKSTGEVILLRDAKASDFEKTKQSPSTLISRPEGNPNLFYEVQVDQQQFLESTAGTLDNEKKFEYDQEATAADSSSSSSSSAGSASIKRLFITPPWQLFSSLLHQQQQMTSTPSPLVVIGIEETSSGESMDETLVVTSPSPAQEIGSPNTDAFFYILIIAGSISFLSIIIGVITSVRRAATWPRHHHKGVIIDSADSNSRSGAGAVVATIDKSNGANSNRRHNRHLHNNRAFVERLLINNSADEQTTATITDGIGGESSSMVIDNITSSPGRSNNNNNRCLFNNSVENSNNNDNSHLYSVIERSCKSSSVNHDHDLYIMDSSSNNLRSYNQNNHSSNSTSPLLSASPQGSSHSSSTRSAVLLGPLPPSLPTTKIIRFADIESDEC